MIKTEILKDCDEGELVRKVNEFIKDENKEDLSFKYSTAVLDGDKVEYSVLVVYMYNPKKLLRGRQSKSASWASRLP